MKRVTGFVSHAVSTVAMMYFGPQIQPVIRNLPWFIGWKIKDLRK